MVGTTDPITTEATAALGRLIERLAADGFRHSIDRPLHPDGEWWLDLSREGYETIVSWRHGRGFGLYVDEESYGTVAPDEIFTDPKRAAERVRQVAAARGH